MFLWLRHGWLGLARGAALFLGLFTLLNLAGDWRHPGFDATLWWIDLRWLDHPPRKAALLFAAIFLLAFAWRPFLRRSLKIVFSILLTSLMAVCAVDAIRFWQLWSSQQILSWFPVPFSLFTLLVLAAIFVGTWLPRPDAKFSWRSCVWVMFGAAGCGILFPLGQMLCFGSTDYRRPADVIVVFGCRVFDDGTPSHALRDRVVTAAELYREGYARRVILSGGPGDGDVHETEAMRRLAVKHGVAEADITLDPQGLNTEATVANALREISASGNERILAVSHFYHLPRVKLCFHRHGSEVYTVPAREEYLLRGLVKFMAREILALDWYYLAPVFDAD